MPAHTRVGGTWRNVTSPHLRVGGVWKVPQSAWTRVSGVWREWFFAGGVLDTTFATNIGTGAGPQVLGQSSAVWGVTEQSDGKILVVGSFTSWNGATGGGIVRLNSDGTRDVAFSNNIGTGLAGNQFRAYKVVLGPSQTIHIIGETFQSWNGVAFVNARLSVIRLNSSGVRDTGFSTNLGTGFVGQSFGAQVGAVQSDGKIILSDRNATGWNGATISGRMVRLNTDGTRDVAFSNNVTGTSTGAANAIEVQADGKIIFAGSYSRFNGLTTIRRVIRLNTDGTRDVAFSNNVGAGIFTGNCNDVAVQTDGKILISGGMTVWNNATIGRIVRLNSDGTRDVAFSNNIGTGADTGTLAIALQQNGQIIVRGDFLAWNGSAVSGIIRLNSDGTRDVNFSNNVGSGPDLGRTLDGAGAETVILSTGKIVSGGVFSTWSGVSAGKLVRIGGEVAG